MENCNQGGHVVVLIIEHVLRTLKSEHPELSNAYLRQDNAACYHSTVMLETCSYMAKKQGSQYEELTSVILRAGKVLAIEKPQPSRHMYEGRSMKGTIWKLHLSLKRLC